MCYKLFKLIITIIYTIIVSASTQHPLSCFCQVFWSKYSLIPLFNTHINLPSFSREHFNILCSNKFGSIDGISVLMLMHKTYFIHESKKFSFEIKWLCLDECKIHLGCINANGIHLTIMHFPNEFFLLLEETLNKADITFIFGAKCSLQNPQYPTMIGQVS